MTNGTNNPKFNKNGNIDLFPESMVKVARITRGFTWRKIDNLKFILLQDLLLILGDNGLHELAEDFNVIK